MSFKGASDSKQKSLRRVLPRHLGDFVIEDLTAEQKRENLIAKLKTVSGEEKKEICLQISLLNKEIGRNKIRNRSFPDLIIAVIKDEVSKHQMMMWIKKAAEFEELKKKLPDEVVDELNRLGNTDSYSKTKELYKKYQDKLK